MRSIVAAILTMFLLLPAMGQESKRICKNPDVSHLSAYEMYYVIRELGEPDQDIEFDGMDLAMCPDVSWFRLMNGKDRVASTDPMETQFILGLLGRVRA